MLRFLLRNFPILSIHAALHVARYSYCPIPMPYSDRSRRLSKDYWKSIIFSQFSADSADRVSVLFLLHTWLVWLLGFLCWIFWNTFCLLFAAAFHLFSLQVLTKKWKRGGVEMRDHSFSFILSFSLFSTDNPNLKVARAFFYLQIEFLRAVRGRLIFALSRKS